MAEDRKRTPNLTEQPPRDRKQDAREQDPAERHTERAPEDTRERRESPRSDNPSADPVGEPDEVQPASDNENSNKPMEQSAKAAR